jgi:putative ABC transport system ATP-binding protein
MSGERTSTTTREEKPVLHPEANGGQPPIYQLRRVSKTYGEGDGAVRALRAVDLAIEQGEFVVVAGPSGSGKSTLLQLLGALDRPSDGILLYERRELLRLRDGELARLRLEAFGFVFQQFNLIPTLTAEENVEVALAPKGDSAARRRSRARWLLEEVGLAERRAHLPGQLSGGEQQRVAIARALANEPRVLLADEPTGNLDTATGQAVLRLLRRLSEEHGQTVVLVTHDAAIADRAPRLVRMSDGRMATETTSAPWGAHPSPHGER